jgi:hypothetical protein
MNLIYSCIFCQVKYFELLALVLQSYLMYGQPSDDTHYLIITHPDFKEKTQRLLDALKLDGNIWCLDLNNKFEAGYSRLKIFDYPDIDKYEKILYLDCDILVTNRLDTILNLDLDNKLYTLKEGTTNHPYWGSLFWDKNPKVPAFTTGVLLFKNHETIRNLFRCILKHIERYLETGKEPPKCYDQPFIVYNTISDGLHDNTMLIGKVKNIDCYPEWNPMVYNNETIVHFPGSAGKLYQDKSIKMAIFLSEVKKAKEKQNNGSDIDIIAVAPSNILDKTKMKYLLESAQINNFEVKIIGSNQEFQYSDKIIWLTDFLKEYKSNDIVIFTDAYDVFYLDGLETIKQKFLKFDADIVWSVEKWYSHQLKSDKKFYDDIAKSNYRYLNSGTFIGYRDKLLEFFLGLTESLEEIRLDVKMENYAAWLRGSDQAIISHYLCKNQSKLKIESSDFIKFDYNCEIFYVAVQDWDNPEKYINADMILTETKQRPSIIHVPWKNKYEHVLDKLFKMTYYRCTP